MWEDLLMRDMKQFESMIGDRRMGRTVGEMLTGIMGAGNLRCQ